MASSSTAPAEQAQVGVGTRGAPQGVVLRAEEVALGGLQGAAHLPRRTVRRAGGLAAERGAGCHEARVPARLVGSRGAGPADCRHGQPPGDRHVPGVMVEGRGDRRSGTHHPVAQVPRAAANDADAVGAVAVPVAGHRVIVGAAVGHRPGPLRVGHGVRDDPSPCVEQPDPIGAVAVPVAHDGHLGRGAVVVVVGVLAEGELAPHGGGDAGRDRAEAEVPRRVAHHADVGHAVAVPVADDRDVARLAEAAGDIRSLGPDHLVPQLPPAGAKMPGVSAPSPSQSPITRVP